MNNSELKKPICPHCKIEMYLDDVDYNFKGNQDEYWLCEKCYIGAIAKVRHNKRVCIEYNDENGQVIAHQCINYLDGGEFDE